MQCRRRRSVGVRFAQVSTEIKKKHETVKVRAVHAKQRVHCPCPPLGNFWICAGVVPHLVPIQAREALRRRLSLHGESQSKSYVGKHTQAYASKMWVEQHLDHLRKEDPGEENNNRGPGAACKCRRCFRKTYRRYWINRLGCWRSGPVLDSRNPTCVAVRSAFCNGLFSNMFSKFSRGERGIPQLFRCFY